MRGGVRALNGTDLGMLILCSAVIGASFVLKLSPTGDHDVIFLGANMPDLCPFHRICGLWCPGCGLTRSFVSMAHGHFLNAVHFNPLGPILFCACALQVLLQSAAVLGWRPAVSPFARAAGAFGKESFLAALLLLGAWRIVWGLSHRSLIQVEDQPPANRLVIAALLVASITAVSAYRIWRTARGGTERQAPTEPLPAMREVFGK